MSSRIAALAKTEEDVLSGMLPPSECKEWNYTLRTICTDYQIAKNIAHALNTGFPEFGQVVPPHDRLVSICGSAPSLNDTYRDIKGDIWACNDAGWKLIEWGVIPKFIMVWDPQPLVLDCLRVTHPDVTYLVASMCDPRVFDLLKERGCKVLIWHPWMGEALPMIEWLAGFETKSRLLVGYGLSIPEFPPDEVVGTSAAVTRSAQFAQLMGYRRQEWHGVDSSCSRGIVHFEDLEVDIGQPMGGVWVGPVEYPALQKKFLTTPQMARQIREFIPLVKAMMADGCTVKVHGQGAIPWLALLRGWHVNSATA